MISENYNNFMIYYKNLSSYYVTCVLISVVAIVFSWYFHFKNVPGEEIKDETKNEPDNQSKIEGDHTLTEDAKRAIFKKIDSMMSLPRNKEILKKCSEEMTEEQLKIEKEVEQEQLSAILELLKNQEEKFQVESMDELKTQLKLYR